MNDSAFKEYESIRRLLELSALLPKGIEADWRETSHFELGVPYSSRADEAFWLNVSDISCGRPEQHARPVSEVLNDGTVLGQRIGLLLDIAEALKAAEDDLSKLVGAEGKE